MGIKTPQSILDAMVSHYLAGMSTAAAAAEYGKSRDVCLRELKRRGIEVPVGGTRQQDRESFCALYSSGLNLAEVSRRTGFDIATIRSVLLKNGVPLLSQAQAQTLYSCNHSFFSNMHCDERSAYWAGFIAADGCIHPPNKHTKHARLTIILSGKDADHLRRFATDSGATYPVRVQGEFEGYRYGKATISLASNQIANDLAKHGITSAKTWTVSWPDLPPDMLRHFLRGLVDGDGCWHKERSGALRFAIVGNGQILSGVEKFLTEQCGLKTRALATRKDSKIKTLIYGGSCQATRIARFLYKDATVFLPRKFEVCRPFLEANKDLEEPRVRRSTDGFYCVPCIKCGATRKLKRHPRHNLLCWECGQDKRRRTPRLIQQGQE